MAGEWDLLGIRKGSGRPPGKRSPAGPCRSIGKVSSMQIFCDESGGIDPTTDLFLAAAVAIPPNGATRLLKSFSKATGRKGREVKGHRLTLEQGRVFFDLLCREDDLGSTVVSCSRRTLVGG